MALKALPFEEPIFSIEKKIQELKETAQAEKIDLDLAIAKLEEDKAKKVGEIFANLTPWQRVLLSRHEERPQTLDYARMSLDEFIEVHGDKTFAEDSSTICGFSRIGERRFMLVGQQRGKDATERVKRNFGMPLPEGYAKARAKMMLAEKFHLPVVTLIDTPGAAPLMEAEERGIARAIAVNLMEMARLRTPIACIVIGQGMSGGALGISVGDRILMLEYSIYSIISPEGCSAILWRTDQQKETAAGVLRLTPKDLTTLGVCDGIVPEPVGGAHRKPEAMAATLKATIAGVLDELTAVPIDELVRRRYDKYRALGAYFENGALHGQTIAPPAS